MLDDSWRYSSGVCGPLPIAVTSAGTCQLFCWVIAPSLKGALMIIELLRTGISLPRHFHSNRRQILFIAHFWRTGITARLPDIDGSPRNSCVDGSAFTCSQIVHYGAPYRVVNIDVSISISI